ISTPRRLPWTPSAISFPSALMNRLRMMRTWGKMMMSFMSQRTTRKVGRTHRRVATSA
ncbi:hypothetical protein FOZ62_030466, partial [Perkinsus olseni]